MLTIAEAKSVPMEDVLAHIAKHYPKDKRGQLHYKRGNKAWFYAIDRIENTPSVVVDIKNNKGHDFGMSVCPHFSTIDLTIIFMRGENFIKYDLANKEHIKGALQLLEVINPTPIIKDIKPEPKVYSSKYQILKRGDLAPRDYRKNQTLRKNLSDRNIDEKIARLVMDHAVVRDNEGINSQSQDCFVWDNIKGGQEVSKPGGWKTCIGPKAISVFDNPNGSKSIVLNSASLAKEGADYIREHQAEAFVFEGITDYLSWLCMGGGKFEPHSIYSFMDNDKAGREAQLVLCDEIEAMDWSFRPLNHIYEGYEDLNDYWMNAPEARTAYRQEARPGMAPKINPKYNL